MATRPAIWRMRRPKGKIGPVDLSGVTSMIRKSSLFLSVAIAGAAVVALAAPASATSDYCIQLEQQFDAVAAEHATDPKLPLAQSYRNKGSSLCNADAEEIGEQDLQQAIRLLGVEPEPFN
jgi:hypothetical protein